MQKIATDLDPEKTFTDFIQKMKDGEIAAGMLVYVDTSGQMFMHGDGHSITLIITNIVMNALHEHLHHEESAYDQRKEFGMEGFIPDDPAV